MLFSLSLELIINHKNIRRNSSDRSTSSRDLDGIDFENRDIDTKGLKNKVSTYFQPNGDAEPKFRIILDRRLLQWIDHVQCMWSVDFTCEDIAIHGRRKEQWACVHCDESELLAVFAVVHAVCGRGRVVLLLPWDAKVISIFFSVQFMCIWLDLCRWICRRHSDHTLLYCMLIQVLGVSILLCESSLRDLRFLRTPNINRYLWRSQIINQ